MIEIETYDQDRHAAFVGDSFARSSTMLWPLSLIPRVSVQGTKAADFFQRGLAGEFVRLLLRSDVRAEVLSVDGLQVAWAAALNGKLLYAFTKEEYRRKGLSNYLIQRVGLKTRPVDVLIWTRACDELAASKPGRVRMTFAEELAR
jgi:hypothetical protein